MKRIAVVLSVLITTVLVIAYSKVALASTEAESETKILRTYNVEQMTYDEVTEFSQVIAEALINDDKKALNNYVGCFTSSAMATMNDYIDNNSISGSLSMIVTDWIYPKYSNSGDSVMMINFKVQNSNYNEVCMIELHINSEGSIYGSNIWMY